jgi:hypothetical protein
LETIKVSTATITSSDTNDEKAGENDQNPILEDHRRGDENFILGDQDFAGNYQCEKFMGLKAKSMLQFPDQMRSVTPVGDGRSTF